jgi:hypothetical protein
MLELIFDNQLLLFNGLEYNVIDLQHSSDEVVLTTIQNDIYYSVIALVANQVTINGVLQTSTQMIIDTLSNG